MKHHLKTYKTKKTILDSTIDILHEEMESVKSDAATLFENRANNFLDTLTTKISDLEAKVDSIDLTQNNQQIHQLIDYFAINHRCNNSRM